MTRRDLAINEIWRDLVNKRYLVILSHCQLHIKALSSYSLKMAE